MIQLYFWIIDFYVETFSHFNVFDDNAYERETCWNMDFFKALMLNELFYFNLFKLHY